MDASLDEFGKALASFKRGKTCAALDFLERLTASLLSDAPRPPALGETASAAAETAPSTVRHVMNQHHAPWLAAHAPRGRAPSWSIARETPQP